MGARLNDPDPKPMSLALGDYAQEINVGSPELLRLSLYHQQAHIARNMARFCKKLRFPFIMPVQFAKGSDGKEEVAERKVCENWFRIQPHGVEIRKRRRGGDTDFVARHDHDDERWCFVPSVPSEGARP